MRITLTALGLSPPCLPLAPSFLRRSLTIRLRHRHRHRYSLQHNNTKSTTAPHQIALPFPFQTHHHSHFSALQPLSFASFHGLALRRISQCSRPGTGYGADLTPLHTFRGLLLRRFSFCEVEVQHTATEDAALCGVVREEMMIHGDDTGCVWRY